MKKLLSLLVIPFFLTGCLDEFKTTQSEKTSNANVIKYQKEIDTYRDNGPQDIICRTGDNITYEHKNIILYRGIDEKTLRIDVYEQDTKEKIIVSGDCNIRPHKQN